MQCGEHVLAEIHRLRGVLTFHLRGESKQRRLVQHIEPGVDEILEIIGSGHAGGCETR